MRVAIYRTSDGFVKTVYRGPNVSSVMLQLRPGDGFLPCPSGQADDFCVSFSADGVPSLAAKKLTPS